MGIEIELHDIQKDILLTLIFSPVLRFSQLNKNKIDSDHFNFHLKRLVKLKLIKKNSGSKYVLTAKGKEFANRLDTDNKVYEKQAKIGVLICCVDKFKKPFKYLVQQRLKEPYFGFYGFITGKVRLGETVFETAKRELKEETGYEGRFDIVGMKHKMDYSKEGKLLEDKFFIAFKVEDLKGEFKDKFEGGKNIWLTEKEISELENLFEDVKETLDLAKQNKIRFLEKRYKVSKF